MYHLIIHITTACNYRCSYCDVRKDGRVLSPELLLMLHTFLEKNLHLLSGVKFFGGEPLLAFPTIQEFVEKSPIGRRFELVSNASLLKDVMGRTLDSSFQKIFFSVDREHPFDSDFVYEFSKKHHLLERTYCNLIVNPHTVKESLDQFQELYRVGFRGYNILPVYFTKPWEESELYEFSQMMKYILNLTKEDTTLRLYGFQENEGYDNSLVNHSLFLDTDGNIYYSDIVSMYSGEHLKHELLLGHIKDFSLSNIDGTLLEKKRKIISDLEKSLYSRMKGQNKLHKMMDYFSHYLNHSHE